MLFKPIILDCNELTVGIQTWEISYLDISCIIFKKRKLGLKNKHILLRENFGN